MKLKEREINDDSPGDYTLVDFKPIYSRINISVVNFGN